MEISWGGIYDGIGISIGPGDQRFYDFVHISFLFFPSFSQYLKHSVHDHTL